MLKHDNKATQCQNYQYLIKKLEWQEEKGKLLCLIVEGDWNYMGSVEVFPQIFKIVEVSK